LTRVDCLQPGQRHIQRQHIDGGLLGVGLVGSVTQCHVSRVCATFVGAARARKIHQNLSHQPGGHGEEVGAVLPLNPLMPDEPAVDLVDQGCGLDGDVPSFAPQYSRGLLP
jgi:hypothetical protein